MLLYKYINIVQHTYAVWIRPKQTKTEQQQR